MRSGRGKTEINTKKYTLWVEKPPLSLKSIPYEITSRKFDNNLFIWLLVYVCVWLWLADCALFGLSHGSCFESIAFYIVNGTFHFYLPVCHMNFDTVKRSWQTKKNSNFARKVLSLYGSYSRKFIRVVVAILNHLFYSDPNHISPVNAWNRAKCTQRQKKKTLKIR